MPDANKENTLNQLVGAAFGAAGQRCMALSTAILVGEAKKWLPELVERAKKLRVNAGNQLLDFASLALSSGFCIGLVQWEQSCLFLPLPLFVLDYLSFRFIFSYHSSFMFIKTSNTSVLFTGDQPGADLGPLITPQAKERVCNLIDSGTKEGASILLDGRSIKVKGYENGNFVGPTIISNVKVTVNYLFHKRMS